MCQLVASWWRRTQGARMLAARGQWQPGAGLLLLLLLQGLQQGAAAARRQAWWCAAGRAGGKAAFGLSIRFEHSVRHTQMEA